MHRLVAFGSFVIHILFVVFAILGGFLAWLMPWVLLPHVASAAWGGRMALFRKACPLSTAENWGREGSGRQRLDEEGFIAHYFENRLYPGKWARRVEMGVAALVCGSWLGLALR